MHELFAYIKSMHPGANGRVFVDSAPVLDRAWAYRAGLGWIGKNSMLISRWAGSFMFIGEIILNVELPYNALPESDFCGSCNRCIEACPTGAILDHRTINSEKCISYQTIENREGISPDIEHGLAGRVFGCDICQDVCPWNRKATAHHEPMFEPRPGILEMSRSDWQELKPEEFENLFHRSAVQRAGYHKIKGTLSSLEKNPKSGGPSL
jgi:epoxyqueuosine reductase